MGQGVKVFFWVRLMALGPKDLPSAAPTAAAGLNLGEGLPHTFDDLPMGWYIAGKDTTPRGQWKPTLECPIKS